MTNLKSAETASPAHKSGHSVRGPWEYVDAMASVMVCDAVGDLLVQLPLTPLNRDRARLIAAAPELYALLERAFADPGQFDDRWADDVAAALSRARGES
jgi:hypothetical protein